MSAPVRKILDEIAQLSPEDRDLLRDELEAIDLGKQEEIDAEWREELARRVKSIEDGTAVLIPHEDVMKELLESLKR